VAYASLHQRFVRRIDIFVASEGGTQSVKNSNFQINNVKQVFTIRTVYTVFDGILSMDGRFRDSMENFPPFRKGLFWELSAGIRWLLRR